MNAATITRRLHLTNSYGITGIGTIVLAVGTLVVLVAVLVSATVLGGRSVGRITCRHWGAQTGFPTKFVVLNFFDDGTCLAQAPNGRWVVNTKVVQFIGATR